MEWICHVVPHDLALFDIGIKMSNRIPEIPSVMAFLKLAVLNGSTWFCSSPAGGISRVVPSSNTGGSVVCEAGEVMMMS